MRLSDFITLYILTLSTRKKCDEVKPNCGLCVLRKSLCIWPERATSKKDKMTDHIRQDNVLSNSFEIKSDQRSKDSISIETLTGSTLIIEDDTESSYTLGPVIPVTSNINPLSEPVLATTTNAAAATTTATTSDRKSSTSSTGNIPRIQEFHSGNHSKRSSINKLAPVPVMDTTPDRRSSTASLDIKWRDNDEIQWNIPNKEKVLPLLDDRKKVVFGKYLIIAQTMSIVGNSNNFFLGLLVDMASKNRCVLNAILTWGGMSIGGSMEGVYRRINLRETLELIKTDLKVKPTRSEYIYYLASYLILVDAEVCTGDVKNWKIYFDMALAVMKDMGLYQDLISSVPTNILLEEKCLAIKFIHYDILSSMANERKTIFPSSLLMNQFQGVDTLQGCLKPILSLLAEAINLGVEARQKYKLLEDPGKINNWKTTSEMNRIVALAGELDAKMTVSKPRPEDLDLIPKKYLETHLSLYELFQFASQIYLRVAVRRYPPTIPEVQILLYKIINLLKFLIRSKIKSSIKYPFLIAGVCCVFECDRVKLMGLLEEYQEQLPSHHSIPRIKSLIEELWKVNPEGLLCLDWYDISSSFGWSLCLF